MKECSRKQLEFIRTQAKQKFDKVRMTMIDCGRWALPHRTKYLLSQTPGERTNQHIVDATHVLALRSFVAGFLEGNTSATRPWYRSGTTDPDINANPTNHMWLDKFTRRTLQVLSSSNFYHAAGEFYYDYGVFNTGAHYIEELETGLFFHTLIPGSYFVINNAYGVADIMVREFQLNVKSVVDQYGEKKNGKVDWSNISSHVKKMYDDSNYSEMVDIVHVIKPNPDFDPAKEQVLLNRQWISYTYEVGGSYSYAQGVAAMDPEDDAKFLRKSASKRKPFIVGKSHSNGFEYGEKGPTLDALGCIKSLNKKAIGKDIALELMLRPPSQGPANLRKSYIAQSAGTYVPQDAQALKAGGIRPMFEVNPAINPLIQDVTDLRQMVDKLYYADYLLYLSRNPKTRTATETNAIVQEQQLIIGPNLQSLNWTYNQPVIEFVMDYVLFSDPWIDQNPPPEELTGNFLRPDFISVFAQAQKAADLPAIDRAFDRFSEIAQINPSIWDKVNLDKLAELYEDRLFLPAGLINEQSKVEAMREQAQAQAQQQQMMQETIPAMAGAGKDLGLSLKA
jgi:hypothetical protein